MTAPKHFYLKRGEKPKKRPKIVLMEKFIPYGLGLGAVVLFSLLGPLFKRANQDLPSLLVMAISMFTLFSVSLTMHFLLEERVTPTKGNVLWLIMAGTINAGAFYLMLQCLQSLPVWHYQMLTLLFPILGALAAYAILGEHFSYKLFIGSAIAAAGIYIAIKPS